MPENLTHGYKKNHQKTAKNSFFKNNHSESGKRLVLLINSVLEDILIHHLRLKENFFLKKRFQKITSINFVGPDPRLLEIGAK